MKVEETEKSLKRVLEGMGAAKPSVQMEGRIVRALEQRARAGESRPVWAFAERGRRTAAAWAALGAVAAGMLLVAVVSGHRQSEPDVSSARTTAAVRTTPTTPLARPEFARAVDQPQPPVRVQRRAGRRPARLAARQTSGPPSAGPLTQQEKLLLQVAASGDTKRMELLNPELQRQQEIEARAEFDRFFNVKNNTGDNE